MAVLQEVFLSGLFEGVDNGDEFGFDADHVGQGSGHDWQTCAALWGYVLCRPTSWNVYYVKWMRRGLRRIAALLGWRATQRGHGAMRQRAIADADAEQECFHVQKFISNI